MNPVIDIERKLDPEMVRLRLETDARVIELPVKLPEAVKSVVHPGNVTPNPGAAVADRTHGATGSA